jgi:hypothetical protein
MTTLPSVELPRLNVAQWRQAPGSLRAEDVLHAQQTAGNRAVTSALGAPHRAAQLDPEEDTVVDGPEDLAQADTQFDGLASAPPSAAQLDPEQDTVVDGPEDLAQADTQLGGLAAAPATPLTDDGPDAQQQAGSQAGQQSFWGRMAQSLRDRFEEADEIRSTAGSELGKSTTDAGFGLGAETPWFAEGSSAESKAKTAGKVGSALGLAADAGGAILSGIGAYRAHKVRSDPAASGVRREKAWKDEKTGAKGVGSNVLSMGGRIAGLASEVAGTPAGVVTGGVDFLRSSYGMVRAAHKARQLGGWTGKGGMVEELEQAKADPSKTEEQRADVEKLQGVAQFAHKTKMRTSLMKSLGMVGAGLGVAGGAVALAAGAMTPVGWALTAGAAGLGLAAGAYKMGRGMWKRSHRRDKLSAAESALGMGAYRAQGNVFKRGWDWMRGNDIKARQQALKEKKAELEAQAANASLDQAQRDDAAAKLDELRTATDKKGKGDLFARAMATEKQRNAHTLSEQLQKDPSAGGFASRIGETLGITSGGKLIQSRGWQFWKKKQDLDIDQGTNLDEMDELTMRKLGSSG